MTTHPSQQANGAAQIVAAMPVAAAPAYVSDAAEREIPVFHIEPAEDNVRKHFDPEQTQALADNIREHGLLNALIVYQDRDRFRLIAGERRWRAVQLLGWKTVRARVLKDRPDDAQRCALALIDNDREDLSDIERGFAYRTYMLRHAVTATALAKKLGKSTSTITRCCKRAEGLPPDLQERVGSTLPPSIADELLSLPDDAKRAIARQYPDQLKTRADVIAAVKAAKNGSTASAPAGFACEESGVRIAVTVPGGDLTNVEAALRIVLKNLREHGSNLGHFREFLAKKAHAAKKAAELQAAQDALEGAPPMAYRKKCRRVLNIDWAAREAEGKRIRALIAADEKERLPLPITIDPPGATYEEVRRNFEALQYAQVSQDLLAILTARFHRYFENHHFPWSSKQPNNALPPVPEEEIRCARQEWLRAQAEEAVNA